MKYFKARVTPKLPYIVWDCVARNESEYSRRGLSQDQLVVDESHMPVDINGVSSVEIRDGILVKRSQTDILSYADEYNKQEYVILCKGVDAEHSGDFTYFTFDQHMFSLSISAQQNWNRILNMHSLNIFTTQQISTYNNDQYELSSDDVLEFAAAYHTAIETILSSIRTQKSV